MCAETNSQRGHKGARATYSLNFFCYPVSPLFDAAPDNTDCGKKPSENGLIADAISALEYLLQRKDIDTSKIYVLGVSLGGAVAIATSSLPQFRGG